ncbi:MAG: NAD(P)H-hydrate dehydratase [Bacteroidia bacterium]
MKILSASQIKQWDEHTIKNKPIAGIDLMEHAATKCFNEIISLVEHNKIPQNFKVFCGTGNNGGDGLVIARLLKQRNFDVEVYILKSEYRTNDFNINYQKLTNLNIKPVWVDELFTFNNNTQIYTAIDALFGSGLNKPLQGTAAQMVNYINSTANFTIAIDMPSGLPIEISDADNLTYLTIVNADLTLTFQVPKFSQLFADTYKYVGNFKVLDIGLLPQFEENIITNRFYVTDNEVKNVLKPKAKYSHKGTNGHVLIAGGSYGKMGSIILSAKAALATGCGLATCYIPKTGYTILQTALPEAMVLTDDDLYELSNINNAPFADGFAIGMGMGVSVQTKKTISEFLKKVNKPLVIDADALNCCAELLNENKHFKFPENCILTPHPKEFDRLAGFSNNSFERFEKQLQFSHKHNVIVVLKGAHTCTTMPNGNAYFNSSGNPLLSTAGSGDVLSGIIASLLAQGYASLQAAICGVYLHGLCADLAKQKQQATMLAGDIVSYLPYALNHLYQN